MNKKTKRWVAQDKAHCWHPFTQQAEWCAEDHEPLVLTRGEGSWLWDSEGRKYLDGNSSIWTNIHGHGHPRIVAAIERQLRQVAHTSYLGFANPRAGELAERLCALWPPDTLERVFFSDDGSTAVECALKLALQFRMQTGEPERAGFVAFSDAYHGDTMGAASLGGVSMFFQRFRNFGMPVQFVSGMDELSGWTKEKSRKLAAVVIEPRIQGVNQMRPWPAGMLRELRDWCDRRGVHLIADEVMTGFGRTGAMFACQGEGVIPDFLCVAKGLSGGFLPLAATFTTPAIYDAFLGGPEKIFYYGHSYTASQLGCAAALASLDIFEDEKVIESLQPKIQRLGELLQALRESHPCVHETRQCGLVAGIELRRPDGAPFPPEHRTGAAVCLAARPHGLLTRPILDTLVLMPPLCTTESELEFAIHALTAAIADSRLPPSA